MNLPQEVQYNKTYLTLSDLKYLTQGYVNSLDMIRISGAYEMAQDIHSNKKRNDETPYFWHVTRVAKIIILELKIYDPDIICASLLHDVIEDLPTLKVEVLANNFGIYPATLVGLLSKDISEKDPIKRMLIDAEYIARIANSNLDCKIIRFSDKLDNMRCLEFNLKEIL